jgi:prepilin-type N-terminal cleavage/methylation domain-containing protein
MHMRNRSGTTIPELIIALVIIGILASLASTSFSSARDIFAVRGARDAIIAAAARTRAESIGHGGATLTIHVAGDSLHISTRDRAVDERFALRGSVGVDIEIDGLHASTAADITYDALGIGRLANRTIRLRRDRAVAGVTFSAYGRPRAW